MKRLLSIRYTDNAVSFALLLLRVALGLMMMVPHGYPKLVGFAEKADRFSDPFGIGSTASLAMAVFAEFFCAVFIILGLFTRLSTIPLIVAMSVALFYSHNGELFRDGEKAALFLTGFIVILFVGPGKISLDKVLGGK